MKPPPAIAPVTAVVCYAVRDVARAAAQVLAEAALVVRPVPADAAYHVLGCAEAGWVAAPTEATAQWLAAAVRRALDTERRDGAPSAVAAVPAAYWRAVAPRLYPQGRLLVVYGPPRQVQDALRLLPLAARTEMALYQAEGPPIAAGWPVAPREVPGPVPF